MAKIEQFEDLRIWQKARELSRWFYEVINTTNLKVDYKLRNQADASIGSVMDNVAEGYERNGKKEFINFLSIAKGSAGEFRSQLYRIRDRNYISDEIFLEKKAELIQLSKSISSFMNYLSTTALKGWKFKEEQTEYLSENDEGFP